MKKYRFTLLLALVLALLLGGYAYVYVRFTDLYNSMNWNQQTHQLP